MVHQSLQCAYPPFHNYLSFTVRKCVNFYVLMPEYETVTVG